MAGSDYTLGPTRRTGRGRPIVEFSFALNNAWGGPRCQWLSHLQYRGAHRVLAPHLLPCSQHFPALGPDRSATQRVSCRLLVSPALGAPSAEHGSGDLHLGTVGVADGDVVSGDLAGCHARPRSATSPLLVGGSRGLQRTRYGNKGNDGHGPSWWRCSIPERSSFHHSNRPFASAVTYMRLSSRRGACLPRSS